MLAQKKSEDGITRPRSALLSSSALAAAAASINSCRNTDRFTLGRKPAEGLNRHNNNRYSNHQFHQNPPSSVPAAPDVYLNDCCVV